LVLLLSVALVLISLFWLLKVHCRLLLLPLLLMRPISFVGNEPAEKRTNGRRRKYIW
jgi:hypothetical protein